MFHFEAQKLPLAAALAMALTVACASAPSSSEAIPPQVHAPGTGPAINLARTSLASVDASSVTSDRPMDNPYYGVLNAFDNSDNWVQNHNYTYWLSGNEEEPYIDVHFDAPVTLTQIEVKAAPGTVFTARLMHADGDETSLPSLRIPAPAPTDYTNAMGSLSNDNATGRMRKPTALGSQDSMPMDPLPAAHLRPSIASPVFTSQTLGSLTLAEPALAVKSVRVEFTRMDSADPWGSSFDSRVHEIRILGIPPDGVSFEVKRPRVFMSERNVRLGSKAALEEWKTSLFEGLTPELVEHGDAFVLTYSKSGKPVCRVSVSIATGQATTVPLVADW
jgi:hypothetical protein